MSTSVFAVTADADDGAGRMQSVGAWVNTPAGVYTDSPFGANLVSIAKHGAGGNFYVVNGYARFDMDNPVSGVVIPLAATIDSASLKMYVDGADAPDGAIADFGADFFDFGGSPSTAADWEWTTSGDAVATITAASMSVGNVNTIPLTGLTGIVKTGFTGIRWAPTNSANAPTADNFIDFAAREHATGQEPRLEVTYTVSAVGASLAWIRA